MARQSGPARPSLARPGRAARKTAAIKPFHINYNTLLAQALAYAARGWPVIPCRPHGKEPLVAGGYRAATTDPDVIRGWWMRWPDANVGIPTGRPSGIIVIDVDPRHGGGETLLELPELPQTVEVITGGGGRHLYFLAPNQEIRCRPNALGPGLDLRGDGGYVLVPPSVHPSGRRYEWELSSHPEDVAIAPLPDWLIEWLAKPETASNTPQTVEDERIPAGRRNVTLTSLAGSMRRRGMTREAIKAALLAENAARCDPPLPEDEVRRIAASVSRYDPAPEPEGNAVEITLQRDYGHATVLAPMFMDRYRWAVHRGAWMYYDGAVWRPTTEEAVAKHAADVLREYYAAQLASTGDKQTVLDLTRKIQEVCTYARISGALNFLRGWDGIMTLAEEWDADPWLLNLTNGTLDLRTGELRAHNPNDLITKLAPVEYDPNAKGERWREHVERFLPNPNVRLQVQRDLGLALPGVTLEESLPIWYGSGANGKTTTARVLLKVLGDYADRAAPNLLLQSKFEHHPTEIADLAGTRLVFSIEVDEGRRLAEALVKELTGGDELKARYMRQDFFRFSPTHSIFLIVNHKPVITGSDDGIWRRIRLIPWDYQIPEHERRPQDDVVAELTADGPAILNWLLDGLQDWQQDRHWVAPEVRAASDAYRAEMDVLGEFIRERCILGPRFAMPKGELYAAYTTWCEENHERPLSRKEFTNRLRDRGIGESREGHARTRVYLGIGLRTDADR